MKFQTVFAVAAAAMIGSVAAQDCSGAQQASAFVALSPLLSGKDLDACATKSGYNMLLATGLPTDEQTAKMCGITECQSLIKFVLGTNPPNCVLTIPTSGAKMNVYNLANDFAGNCARLVTPAPATPTTAAPSTPSTGGTPATATPATKTPSTPSTGGTPAVTPTPTKVAC